MDAPRRRRRLDPARRDLLIDAALLVAMLLSLAPLLTGIAVHEWLAIGFWLGVVIHLLLHWDWTVNALRRFVGRLPGNARVNLALAILFFVALTLVMYSGLVISREALPMLGLTLRGDRSWEQIHRISADWLILLTGLHVALHWRWILVTGRRLLWDPLRRLARPRPLAAAEGSSGDGE